MAKNKRKFQGFSPFELRYRESTLEHALFTSLALTSIVHPTRTKLKKEGREWSVYVSRKIPKIKQWGMCQEN